MKILSPKLIFSLLLIGAAAGITGIVLTLLLHTVQHLAFGYPLNMELSYRVMVEESSPLRRLTVLLLCGGLVGVGWVMLHRLASPLISIKTAVVNGQKMPLAATLIHALLQIVTVGLGSPLGREVAPREISAALAERWAASRGLDEEERKILLACASGAGLAAVYNVPLAAGTPCQARAWTRSASRAERIPRKVARTRRVSLRAPSQAPSSPRRGVRARGKDRGEASSKPGEPLDASTQATPVEPQ